MFHHKRQDSKSSRFKNHLVIYGLFSQREQLETFTKTIETIAQNLIIFESICFISDNQVKDLLNDAQTENAFRSMKNVKRITGIKRANEIYLCRDQQFINILLLNTYKRAQKICYGDGIGIYYSESYYYKTFEGQNKIPHLSYINYNKNKLGFSLIQKKLQLIKFDKGYFSIPFVDAVPNMHFEKTNIKVLYNLLKTSSQIIPERFFPLLTSLSGKRILLVLTSNFSEGLRITEEDELNNYLKLIFHYNEVIDTIIIKPHPRDNIHKIEKLSERLKTLNKEILLLNESILFYTPVEIILFKIIELTDSSILNNMKVLCFTSAGISFPILFNLYPQIGFGEEIVKNTFVENYINPRIKHEADLNFILKKVQSEI